MRFVNSSYDDFVKQTGNKKIVLFGVSTGWRYYTSCFSDIVDKVLTKVVFIVDNNTAKQETKIEIEGRLYDVHSPDTLKDLDNYLILLVVNMVYQESICEQLLKYNLPADVECYSLPLMAYAEKDIDNSCVDEYFKNKKDKVIPAIIHSFWFSGEEKPDLYKRCIESWYKYCPDFEIKEWNANNYDISKNEYMQEAYERKKWAFVSDYARLDIVHMLGGVYMDMDVELFSNLNNLLYANSFFFRQDDGFLELGSGFGAPKGDALIKELLDTYNNRHLILHNGEIDNTPQPEWIKWVLEKNGIVKGYDSQIVNGRLIMSNDYITCFSGDISEERAKLGIHWHNGGWLDEEERRKMRKSYTAKKLIQEKYFVNA